MTGGALLSLAATASGPSDMAGGALLGLGTSGATGASPGLLLTLLALSVIPFLALLTTSFVKVAVVLAIFRHALGAAQIIPASVATGLGLLLTLFIMAPVGERMLGALDLEPTPQAADALTAGGPLALVAAADAAKEPLRAFMLRHAKADHVRAFAALGARLRGQAPEVAVASPDFVALTAGFVVSELERAFAIGLLIFIPFLVIDLVVANLVTAVGLTTLGPATVALPFKLLLFVMADGWALLLRGLVESYV